MTRKEELQRSLKDLKDEQDMYFKGGLDWLDIQREIDEVKRKLRGC